MSQEPRPLLPVRKAGTGRRQGPQWVNWLVMAFSLALIAYGAQVALGPSRKESEAPPVAKFGPAEFKTVVRPGDISSLEYIPVEPAPVVEFEDPPPEPPAFQAPIEEAPSSPPPALKPPRVFVKPQLKPVSPIGQGKGSSASSSAFLAYPGAKPDDAKGDKDKQAKEPPPAPAEPSAEPPKRRMQAVVRP